MQSSYWTIHRHIPKFAIVTNEVCHHRPTSEMPLKWRFAGGTMMAQPLVLA